MNTHDRRLKQADSFADEYQCGQWSRHLRPPGDRGSFDKFAEIRDTARELLESGDGPFGIHLDQLLGCAPRLRPCIAAMLDRPDLAFPEISKRSGMEYERALRLGKALLDVALVRWHLMEFSGPGALGGASKEASAMVSAAIKRHGLRLGHWLEVGLKFDEFQRDEVLGGDGFLALAMDQAAQWARRAGLDLWIWMVPANCRALMDAQLAMPETFTARERLLWNMAINASFGEATRHMDKEGRLDWTSAFMACNRRIATACRVGPGDLFKI